MPLSVRTVFFDIDGTLLNHRLAADKAIIRLAKVYCPTRSNDESISLWNALEQEYFHQFEQGIMGFQEQRRVRLSTFFGEGSMADEDLDRIQDEYLAFYRDNWSPFPDAIPALERCRRAGLRVAVISNGDHVQQLDKLHRIHAGVPDEFVFSSEALGYSKPDQRAFTSACEQMSSSPKNSFMIGDDAINDYVGARSAGLNAVLIQRQGGRTKDGITSLDDIAFE